MNICILIPVFNEAQSIGSLVSEIRSKGLPVLVIDDGSKDESVRMARESGAEVIAQEKNHGKGYTLKKGIEHVRQLDYTGVIMMDGDGQHAVSDLDIFLTEARKHPQSIINGNRMADSKGMPVVRVLTNKAMSLIISWAAGCRIPDTQCGYRYIGMDVLRKIQLETDGFEIETEILIRSSKAGFKILSVPIQTIYGNETSSIQPFRDTIKFLAYYFKEIFRRR